MRKVLRRTLLAAIAGVGLFLVVSLRRPTLLRNFARIQDGQSTKKDISALSARRIQLQAVQAIEPTYSFSIHQPSLSSEEHPDPFRAKSWPRMRELADAQTQRTLVLRPAPAIPRGPTELGQLTGPLHLHAEGRLKPDGQLAAARGP